MGVASLGCFPPKDSAGKVPQSDIRNFLQGSRHRTSSPKTNSSVHPCNPLSQLRQRKNGTKWDKNEVFELSQPCIPGTCDSETSDTVPTGRGPTSLGGRTIW